MSILPKVIKGFNAIPNKILQLFFFAEVENSTPQITWNLKGLQWVKTILKNIGKTYIYWFQNLLQNGEPRSKPTHLW